MPAGFPLPLADRILAVGPALIAKREARLRGTIGAAITLIFCLIVVPAVVAVGFGQKIMTTFKQTHAKTQITDHTDQAQQHQMTSEEISLSTRQAWEDMEASSSVIEKYRTKTGKLPMTSAVVYTAWNLFHPESEPPVDPFDGYDYGYKTNEDRYVLWSEGPSPDKQDDDLLFKREK